MIAKKPLAMVGFALLAAALVLSGCGGKKKSESTTTEPTQASSNVRATTPPSTTSAGNSGGGGDAAAGQELAAIYANFVKAKSWRAAVTVEAPATPKQEGSMEYVAPNKYHFTLAQVGEFIQIGTDTYLKAGPTWIKSPGAGTGNLFTVEAISETLNNVKNTTKKGGSETVNGTRCQVYTVTESDGTTDNICAANGLPLRVIVKDGSSTTTIVFADYEKVGDIKAPI